MFWIALFFVTGVLLGNFGLSLCQRFTVQPQDKLNLKYSTVTFYCKATGLVNPSYYWLKDGVNVTRGTSGFSTQAYFTLTSLTFGDAGLYSCCAVGSTNSITSNTAKLVVRGSPEISQTPSAISPHEGEMASFRCIVIGYPQPTISWYNDSVLLSNGGRIKIFDNGTLVVSNVMKSDARQYKLEASNSLGVTYAFADLTVLDPPSVPYFTTTPQNETAKENSDVTFYCAASGSPKPALKWIRLGGVIPSDRSTQPRPGALRLSGLVSSDDGAYACVARNTRGERRATVYLRIEGYPRFTISPSNKEIEENKSISFSCAASSQPQPTIQWLLPNGTSITSHSKPSGNVRVLPNNTLVIDRVKAYHGGVYTCVAINALGSRKKEVELSVLTAPRFTSYLRNTTKTSGQELTITCPARGSPAPEFQWIFGGNVIQTRQALYFAALKIDNQGYYLCRANNSLGVTSGMFYLRVLTIPVITKAPDNVTVGNDATASFHCRAQGDPTPTVTWLKSGGLVQSNGRYSILPNGTLSVSIATGDDQGWFLCRAENVAGRDEEKAYLVVTDAPTFTEFPTNQTVRLQEQVIFRCRAVAQDKPKITWHKVTNDGAFHKVTSGDLLASGDLSFNSVGRGDRSMYACQACNAAGCKFTPKVMLNVLYGPTFQVLPSSVGVLQGRDAVLKCEPNSSPKARITWRRPNGKQMQGTDYKQIVPNVQPGDTGDYSCKATNPYGDTAEVKVKLEIHTKPVIINLIKRESSGKTTITCEVDGQPTPSVTWYLDKERLPQNAKYPDYSVTRDKTLIVPVGSLKNKTFLCNASNPQGFEVYFAKVPERPSYVSIPETRSHSLRVTWIRPSPPEFLITRYILEVWSAASLSWQLVNSTIKDTSYQVSQLSPFTMYTFRVKAANGLGTSERWRTSNNVTTLLFNPSVPQYLSLTVQNAHVIKVTWSAPRILNGPLSDLQYHVVYKPKTPNLTNEFDVPHDGSVGTQEYILVDLEPDMGYSIGVRAWRRRSDGIELQSSEVTASARTFQLVPKTPPIGLVVEASGPKRIIVKWKKPPYSISGYNIWYRQNKPGMTHTKVHISDGATTTYLIMSLKEHTEYQVKAQMYSNVGEGPFSKYHEVRTSLDAFLAVQNQDEKGTSWGIAVGGLVCGLLLLLLVIGIIWCLRRRSQLSNQTFRVSRRRRRAQSDVVASSVESDGTAEGNYNVAFNHELDHNLDLDMFSDDGHVIPISSSYRNERAIQYLATSKPEVIHNVPRGDSAEGVYANLPKNGPFEIEGLNNDIADSDLSKNDKKNDGERYSNRRDSIDRHEKAPFSNNLERPEVGIPVYAQVDLSKKKTRQPSIDSELDHYPTHETNLDDDNDEEDISEVPFPDEELPRMERSWTNVSEFNFPPPPTSPPPDDLEVPNTDSPCVGPTNDGPNSYEEPYENVEVKNTSDKEPKVPKDKGPKKRRMVAAWAEDDEPLGNLWEAVDKELDRRLGTT